MKTEYKAVGVDGAPGAAGPASGEGTPGENGKYYVCLLYTSYTARHTWATTAYYCEIHPGIISEAMGHLSLIHI